MSGECGLKANPGTESLKFGSKNMIDKIKHLSIVELYNSDNISTTVGYFCM